MGIEPTSEAWEASILPLYDARSFLQLCDYTQRGNGSYRPATPPVLQIPSGKRTHTLSGRRGLFVGFLAQEPGSGRGNCAQAKSTKKHPHKRTHARISPPETRSELKDSTSLEKLVGPPGFEPGTNGL